MNIRPVGAELFHTDGQTDTQTDKQRHRDRKRERERERKDKVNSVYRNSGNALKNVRRYSNLYCLTKPLRAKFPPIKMKHFLQKQTSVNCQ
jgi:hypothetical protein